MGMYTRLYMTCKLDKADETDIEILKKMVEGRGSELIIPPEKHHKLFDTERWTFMLNCDSYYFNHVTNSKVAKKSENDRYYYLTADSDFKDYDNEIEEFIDWVKTLSTSDGFIGFYQYEEAEEPTLIYW